ncbi:baculoviral IAP repeat-containing protein 7-like [Dreissena polymorpha]|uniref:baculoviral IAP repeat-containing protein 7-like n=1 Tax=Dreissena polymorpha TaxID=45954 RepID=UPI002263DFFD|nr:baculoviral IAP repeat-containing protein 7-like [Dreissena polymorpha]
MTMYHPQTLLYLRDQCKFNMNHAKKEELIQEVSELLYRRLDTSTLQGEFRNILELHVQQQLAATGTEGQSVEQFIRSIPQPQPHQQNDFSSLGIPVQGRNSWDNIFVTSISASALPYTQTNLHLSREISALKAQLLEMKNMMKNSFDLQMDIQMSIRQIVAAGIAAASGILPTATAALSRPVNDTHCLICLDNHSNSVLYQCGHMCVCFPCGRHLMDRGAKCPVCRAPIRDIIRAYKCNSE